ncbi:hypothetical protein AKJ41_01625 [candidate division MSBL1 archaeon SCGC-AAA259O05]|uniref:Ribbon-helix-helix protein CopG domain-containing protein n=1 Tax=candidate division MSBL1 archaeon SCGC-AAA259O05 TaxID=1698271 RepID=A0A133V4P9_9EURY|nr:hypothetical protein AKJ41_01625 [candidate division MSBL1 archaeon SCGC-AAA259O05]
MSLPPREQEEITSLVEEGRFTSQSDVLRTAFRIMLEERPKYRIDIAINLYKKGEISISRATEIAGVSQGEFNEILERRDIVKEVERKEDESEKVEKLKSGMNE